MAILDPAGTREPNRGRAFAARAAAHHTNLRLLFNNRET